ncbi:hypothetical protein DPEC_G00115250 [Dallia pectoralis]|uniref:Uncharacterized protein n=1 Tax=Dallia pectoralis TaxID=75939 RepID=A0ACC2GUD6_DALPE|nr:hypothetical protein DPEC_G00115250 [Dallia pectoralis]
MKKARVSKKDDLAEVVTKKWVSSSHQCHIRAQQRGSVLLFWGAFIGKSSGSVWAGIQAGPLIPKALMKGPVMMSATPGLLLPGTTPPLTTPARVERKEPGKRNNSPFYPFLLTLALPASLSLEVPHLKNNKERVISQEPSLRRQV